MCHLTFFFDASITRMFGRRVKNGVLNSFYLLLLLPFTPPHFYQFWCCFRKIALNEALKQEVDRLRVETGELATHSDAYDLGMHHVHYHQSAFFDHPNRQIHRFNPFQSSTATHQHHMVAGAHVQDPLGRFQGLDISSRGFHPVKSEGPSASASESSSTFWWFRFSRLVRLFIDWHLVSIHNPQFHSIFYFIHLYLIGVVGYQLLWQILWHSLLLLLWFFSSFSLFPN